MHSKYEMTKLYVHCKKSTMYRYIIIKYKDVINEFRNNIKLYVLRIEPMVKN